MMKGGFDFLSLLLRLVVFFVAAVAFGAHAQESAAPEDAGTEVIESAADADADADAEGEGESAEVLMQRLFFSSDERMTLEVLRRDKASAELEASTKVFPVILFEEPFDGGAKVTLERDEEAPLEISAMVRRHSDGRTFLWIGDEGFDLQKDNVYLDKTSHLILDPAQISSDGIIGIDRISQKRFRVLVGQSIDAEGRIRDNYPAIVVRKQKQ